MRDRALRDVARWFHVPLHLIGDLEGATFSNIEHQYANMHRITLIPLAQSIAREIELKLIRRPDVRVRFDFDWLTQGDFKTLVEAVGSMINNGLIHRNEGRDILGFDPLPGKNMDKTTVQTALTLIENLDKEPAAGAADGDGAPPPGGRDDDAPGTGSGPQSDPSPDDPDADTEGDAAEIERAFGRLLRSLVTAEMGAVRDLQDHHKLNRGRYCQRLAEWREKSLENMRQRITEFLQDYKIAPAAADAAAYAFAAAWTRDTVMHAETISGQTKPDIKGALRVSERLDGASRMLAAILKERQTA